jgi:hypothetical protein
MGLCGHLTFCPRGHLAQQSLSTCEDRGSRFSNEKQVRQMEAARLVAACVVQNN